MNSIDHEGEGTIRFPDAEQRVGTGWHFNFLRPPIHVHSAEDAAAYLDEDVYDLGYLAESLARVGADPVLLALMFEDMHGVNVCMAEVLSGTRAPEKMETPTLESAAFRLLLREAGRMAVSDQDDDPGANALSLVRILGRVASASDSAASLREVA